MFKRSLFVIGVFAVAFMAFAHNANAQGGVFLGSRDVRDRSDRDTMVVGAARGTFDRLQFRIGNHAVDFKRVVVHFENGTEEELDLRNRIPAGGQSRWINLRGNDRRIKRIEFWYDAATWKRGVRSRVSAYGAK